MIAKPMTDLLALVEEMNLFYLDNKFPKFEENEWEKPEMRIEHSQLNLEDMLEDILIDPEARKKHDEWIREQEEGEGLFRGASRTSSTAAGAASGAATGASGVVGSSMEKPSAGGASGCWADAIIGENIMAMMASNILRTVTRRMDCCPRYAILIVILSSFGFPRDHDPAGQAIPSPAGSNCS